MSDQIPVEFIRRAQEHLKQTGEPLLEYRLADSDYHTFVEAMPTGDDYTLVISSWEPPFSTWREYMDWQGWSEDEMREWSESEGLFEPPEEDEEEEEDKDAVEEAFEDWLDEPIDDPYMYLAPRETDTGRVYDLLEDLVNGSFTAVAPTGEPTAITDIQLGEVEFVEGTRPGDDTTMVTVTSGLALSCLQYILDEHQAGIQIV